MKYKRIVLNNTTIENLCNLLRIECKNCPYIKYDYNKIDHYCERYKGYVTYNDTCIEEGL